MLTSVDATAGILGTRVEVIAVDVVNDAIAVIVDAIAFFLDRNLGITVGEAAAGAEANPGTGAMLVGHGTEGIVAFKECRFGAFAGFLGHALAGFQAEDRSGHLALITRRATAGVDALAPAEPPVVAIVKTEVGEPPGRIAVIIVDAGLTKHRQGGETGIE